MIILLALIALVFVHIAYKDIKHRLVYRYDLLALVALRVIALVVVLLEITVLASVRFLG